MACFTMLDGATTIGGTKLLFEAGSSPQSTRLLFDFGLNYATMGAYFEEFLAPRTSAGLTDYLMTGLLPKKRLYRSDLTELLNASQPELAKELEDPGCVTACFVTHAHVDHTGSLSFLDETIPVYATPVTAAVLHAVEDSQPSPGPEDAVTSFILRPNLGTNGRGQRELRALTGPVTFPDCRVTAFSVDHSIPGACAYLIDYDGGTAVYTGDLRFHGRMGHVTRATVTALAAHRPDTVIIEGTNLRADRDEKERPEPEFRRRFAFWSEQEVEQKALEECRMATGLVLADFGMKDLDRLMTFQRVAKATGRRLGIVPRDAFIVRQAQQAGYPTIDLDDPSVVLYIKRGGSGMYDRGDIKQDWARDTILRFAGADPCSLSVQERRDAIGDVLNGSRPRIVRAAEVSAHQSAYLLSLGYWDIQELCDLHPDPGSLYIHSSAEAFNEEMHWSQERLARWLRLAGMDSVHIHASGHAAQQDLFKIVEELAPARVCPVHTEHPERYAERFADTVTQVSNGQRILL